MKKEKTILPNKEFRKKRRREKTRQKISEISFGTLNKLCELVLFSLIFTGAMLKPRIGLATSFVKGLSQDLANVHPEIDIKRWIEGFRTIKRRRWIDGSGALTKEGRERLKNLFPKFYPERHWDGIWYIVNFDIPETLHSRRDVLRSKLKLLGLGMLQQSVWISTINFLGTVQQIVEEMELSPFVLCSKATELGEEDSKILANRVWRLSELNEKYERFIAKYEKGIEEKKLPSMLLEFMGTLSQDPQLPVELLPSSWKRGDAYELVKQYCREYQKGKFAVLIERLLFVSKGDELRGDDEVQSAKN